MDRNIPASRVEEAVRLIRSARERSEWQSAELRGRIARTADDLPTVVLGQDRALRKITDVLARAALGLSGPLGDTHPTRPRGVLFLAGPTGVGKTEAAKQIATAVFGRREAMIRFDMSEFSAEHSDARLVGAPPGYLGHDAGGELTNAVRTRPFSLLLFDEIDKAHPAVLDKFLQILDEGRLTDARGRSVYFTDTLIVFTSNFGASADVLMNRDKGPRGDFERRIQRAIREHFLRLQRPELLNRIGDNIVVFDALDPDIAHTLLSRAVESVVQEIRRRTGHQLVVSDAARKELATRLDDPEVLALGGGRAVAAVVESRLVNPLARRLLNLPVPTRITVERITEDAGTADLDLELGVPAAGTAAVGGPE